MKSYNSPIEDHFNSLVDNGGGGLFVIRINDEDEGDYDTLINNRDKGGKTIQFLLNWTEKNLVRFCDKKPNGLRSKESIGFCSIQF